MKNTLINLFALALFACGQQNSENYTERLSEYAPIDESSLETNILDSAVVLSYDSDAIKGAPSASTFLIDRSYIPLKTPENLIIGALNKIIVRDDHIMVLDRTISKSVILFDLAGNYQFVVGNIGGGPGEHDEPIDFDFKDGMILLLDRQFVLHQYDLKNQWQKSTRIPFYGHHVFQFKSGDFALTSNTTDYVDLSYHMMFLSENEILKRTFPNKYPILSYHVSDIISYNPGFHDNSFLFAKQFENDIYEVSSDHIIKRYTIANSENIPLGEYSDKEMLNEALRNNQAYSYIWALDNMPILETSSLLIFRHTVPQDQLMIIYDKASKQTHAYDGSINDDILFGGLEFGLLMHASGDHVYTPLNAEAMYSAKKQIAALQGTDKYDAIVEQRGEFMALWDDIEEASNPIIMKSQIGKLD